MVGICNALVAQSLTTQKEYYDWYGWHLKRKYTVLPDGTMHGKEYNYREDGTLQSIVTYDHDDVEAYIEYYQDGKTIAEKYSDPSSYYHVLNDNNGPGNFYRNVSLYDTRGKVTAQYTMKYTPNQTYYYYDCYTHNRLTSYSDGEWKYTLSSDGNRAEIKNLKNGSHFTYDYKKEQLTIHSWKVDIEGKYDKWNNGNYDKSGKVGVLTIKGSTATYHFDMAADVKSNGYYYRFNQGDKGTFQFKNTISMSIAEFCLHFFDDADDRAVAIKDPSIKFRIGKGSYYAWQKELYREQSNLVTMSDYLSQGCTNPITAIDVMFDVKWVDNIHTEKRNLRLEKEVNSVQYFKDDRCSATVKNGKIIAFSNVSENFSHFVPTLFEVAPGEDGFLKIIMKEGATKPADNVLLEGKYVDFELVEGRKTTTSEDYYNRLNIVEVEEGEFANGNLIQGLKRITKTDQRRDIRKESETTYEGTFRDGSLINGTEAYKESGKYIVNTLNNKALVQREITHSNGSKVRMKGVIKEVPVKYRVWNGSDYVTKTENEIQLLSGDLEIELTRGDDLYIKKSFSDIYLNAKTFKCSIPSNKICLVKKNGDRFEGVIPDELLNSLVGEYIEHKSSVQVIKGKYTTAGGNMLEGTFKKRDILYKGLDPRLHISGSADFITEFGRYTGGYAKGKAEGDGKIIIDDLGELKGTFAGDKISKDAVCTVDFKLTTGDTFKGQMLGGKAHGHCELRFANGDYYIGKFENGKFTGTGDVRYTHSKGVYEGKVKDFVCQYDTPQGKKALKKIKAPKMPKITLPSKVGKMYVIIE